MDRHEIESCIRRAFNCIDAIESISAAEYEQWNHQINLADDRTLKKYLPLLLIRELWQDRKPFQGTGDQLVYFLDGYARTRDGNGQIIAGRLQKGEAKIEIVERTFGSFEEREARAILTWLRTFAFNRFRSFCGDDVESAIRFWKEKLHSIKTKVV